uniref:Uncharacterized protein n=1 Tax=Nelumbo nucifera TaxID=4432 RepID=A0A822YIV2_NELNU|nr:TPA_asm: hypothetical protein HUJ06_010904 [Nelumbo nucifera]
MAQRRKKVGKVGASSETFLGPSSSQPSFQSISTHSISSSSLQLFLPSGQINLASNLLLLVHLSVVEGESGGERFHGPLIDWNLVGGGPCGGRETASPATASFRVFSHSALFPVRRRELSPSSWA